MSDNERPLIEEILDYAVYAPLGLAITVLEDLPGLVNRGKSKLAPQIGIARFASKMAFRQVRRSIEDLLKPSTPSEEPPPEANEILDLTGTEGVVIEARGHVTEAPAPAPELAIPAYDTLAASQIVARLNGLNAEELRSVRLYEETHRARRTILARITQLEQADDAD
jgi:hypothetical protein